MSAIYSALANDAALLQQEQLLRTVAFGFCEDASAEW